MICYRCEFWDSDREGCTCPSYDKWYACPIESNKTHSNYEENGVMKVYHIEITERPDWDENYETIVVACDELHAEEIARQSVYGWKERPLKVTEVDLTKECVYCTCNAGS